MGKEIKDLSKRALRLFLVEDDPNQARLYSMLLKEEGYMISTAGDADEAIKELEKLVNSGNYPDCLVVDESLPRTSGIEFIRDALKLNYKFPVILHTGFSNYLEKNSFARRYADEVVLKSTDVTVLKEAINRTIENYQASSPSR